MWWGALVFAAAAVWLGPYAGAATALWVGGVLGAAAAWIDVVLHPWVVCTWCRGNSKVRDQSGKAWRFCFWCSGSGRRRRVLARRQKER